MLRLISSIVGGLIIAFAVVFVADLLFHALSSSATSPAKSNDPVAMREYVASQPVGVLLALVLGWAGAAFIGSAIAARFGGHGEWPGWVVTILFLMATTANFVMVHHPTWMVVGTVAAIVAAGWVGSRLGAGARGARA